ncbi:hypothetical protein PTSG_02216 [Salpingoeca rosetta]|uniref:Uncharacterized protein n=1 Tax=Salpingoeca rosetta (strain ATCC 50818 / BSB-021) TaxID=946362 RepID=F2U1J6_SALR5|nr:uncharacterized protein PTSG_02216 [Salpingoeca rosetta]EGD81498.1 hypothetical protein PTSG_02216 [Salpingoeca rosetta]|eukprot:XP_004996702.1 hypothetical protein PTSG_02216 [Salpingoeca rosetta]
MHTKAKAKQKQATSVPLFCPCSPHFFFCVLFLFCHTSRRPHDHTNTPSSGCVFCVSRCLSLVVPPLPPPCLSLASTLPPCLLSSLPSHPFFSLPLTRTHAMPAFGTRMEIASSANLSPVQADLYWRRRYRVDALRSKSWTESNFVQAKRNSMRSPRTSTAASEPTSPRPGKTSSNASPNTLLPPLTEMPFANHQQQKQQASPSTKKSSRIRRRRTEPGSLADEHLRHRTLRNSRTFEAMPSWDRDLFAPLPPVPESRKPLTDLPDCRPRRRSKVGDVETKVDPVKRRQDSDPKPSRLPKLPPGTRNPWNAKNAPLKLSLA